MNEESIFAVALGKNSTADRQAYLDEACAGNPELRAQVEDLLKASDDAGSFLNHPPVGMDATIAATSADDTAGDDAGPVSLAFLHPCETPGRLGKLVGKTGEYEVIEVVGQGGMGAVLRAFETKLSRIVAVKIMAPELAANPQAVKRFLREAKSAAAVHHDHVVTIHAVDDTHRPPFIVMQFIEGQTLQQKIDKEGALELKQILRIGSQTAAGLAAAHRQGQIHRDVKPGNILLENGVERVKITDFGLARAADDVEVTQTGVIAGTPQYMSPEQARGEVMDARSDLFSLGSVLYSMCTGRPAFRAETTMGVLKRVCEDAPRPIHEVNAETPPWLAAIVNKLLAKNPADRFQTAAEVAEQLGQHLAHLQSPSQVARPATVMLPPAKPAASHDQTSGSFLAVIILAFLGVVVVLPLLLLTLSFFGWYFYKGEPSPDKVFVPEYGGMLSDSATIGSSSGERAGPMALPTVWPSSPEGFLQLAANAPSFEPIFNGQNLTGWELPPREPPTWNVVDGVLVGRGGYSYLVTTRRDYRDFHLRAQVRINDGGNSGLYFRAELPADWKDHGCVGYEAEITNTDEGGKTGSLRRYPQSPVLAQVDEPLVPAGEWFTYEVIAAGNRIETFVNGQPAASATDDTHVQGRIALQLIRGETTVVEFRMIELKELLPASLFAAGDWTPLFSGQDLAGWKAHPDEPGAWSVKDGAIVGRGKNHYLYSERGDYQDFWLRAEVKLAAQADSGLLVRMAPLAEGPAAESGYEVQLAGDPKHVSPTASIIRHGSLVGGQLSKGRGDLIEPARWFVLDIAAIGPTLTVAIDGRPVASYRDDRPRPSGHIALQAFSDAAEVSFRKIEISELGPAKDWMPLFDGSSLAGWKLHPDRAGEWKVKDGVLTGTTAQTYLFSERDDYENFHLRLEARINDGGDSGIYFRTPFELAWMGINTKHLAPAGGYEAELHKNPDHPEKTGSIFGLGTVTDDSLIKPNEWFILEVIADGNRFVTKVNGREVVDCSDTESRFTKGHFALQVFGTGTVVEFRKIEIKELPSSSLNLGQVPALRELVAAQERNLELVKAQFDAGKETATKLTTAESELLEARIRLADAEGSPAAVVSLLKELVSKLMEQRTLVQQRVDAGFEVPTALSPVDAKIADAEARLAKAEAAAKLK